MIGAAPETVLTQAAPGSDPVQTARDIVADYADGLGIADPDAELVAEPATELEDGRVVRFTQTVSGIPVFASGIVVRLNADNAALSVSSTAVPTQRTAGMDLAPTIDQAGAIAMARTAIPTPDPDAEPDKGDPEAHGDLAPDISPEEYVASTPEMMVYDATIIGGDPNAEVLNGPRLIWSLTLTSPDETASYRVFVDAVDPTILLVYSEIPGAISRFVCDYGNTPSSQKCRDEDTGFVSGRTEMNRAFRIAGEIHNFYLKRFGRNSWDGKGAPIKIDTRYCRKGVDCPLVGAGWIRGSIFLGQQFGNADDIIAHEFNHGVIRRTANLAYYAESGAIHESFADVLAEIIDQRYDLLKTDRRTPSWTIGEDTQLRDDSFQGFRSLRNPPYLNDPDRVLSPLYNMGPASDDNMGVHTNSGVGNKAAYLLAKGGSFNGVQTRGIGNRKTAAIYYEALTSVLTVGSDWIDLFWGLQQACKNLVGRQGIIREDCAQVYLAVLATQMDKAEQRRDLVPDSCPYGSRTNIFGDDAESGLAGWVKSPGKWAWRSSNQAAQTPPLSFYAPNPAGTNRNDSFDNWMQTKTKIKIPWVGGSFMRFEHNFDLEYPWDGGVVEYSTDGIQWRDAGTHPFANGYNGKVFSASSSPLKGREAFTGKSRGFQETMLSLAHLRGRRVFIRFRVGANGRGRGNGWFVDDVTLFNCAKPIYNPPSGYQQISPVRLIDTRKPVGLIKDTGKRKPGEVLKINARKLGIFEKGHTPTALNLTITAVENSSPGEVTAYPCGTRPRTSTLYSPKKDATVVNSATVPLSSTGQICIYNLARTHLVIDILGYQTSTKGSAPPSRYRPVRPRRVIDTRNSKGLVTTQRKRAAGSTLVVDISNFGIFTKDTTPRALDLTITTDNNRGPGFVTAWPCGTRPRTSVLTTSRSDQVVSNTVTVPVSSNDKVCLYTSMTTDLVVDIAGYYSNTGPKLSIYKKVTPQRVVDTRNSSGLYKTTGVVRAGRVLRIPMNRLGVNRKGHRPTAWDLTFQMIQNNGPGFVTAYPCGSRPNISTVNATDSRTVIANTATVPASSSGEICVFAAVTTHLTIDVVGYHYR